MDQWMRRIEHIQPSLEKTTYCKGPSVGQMDDAPPRSSGVQPAFHSAVSCSFHRPRRSPCHRAAASAADGPRWALDGGTVFKRVRGRHTAELWADAPIRAADRSVTGALATPPSLGAEGFKYTVRQSACPSSCSQASVQPPCLCLTHHCLMQAWAKYVSVLHVWMVPIGLQSNTQGQTFGPKEVRSRPKQAIHCGCENIFSF